MDRSLRVAVAQPVCVPGDLVGNAARHAAATRSADADLVVFPELSLTGYDLSAPPVDPDGSSVQPIVEACAAGGCSALVGAPVAGIDTVHIAQLLIDGSGARVAYRKAFLGGDEAASFAAGSGPAAVEVKSWRVGVGICKDTRIDEHIGATLDLGIDLYAAGLVHAPDEVGELAARAERIVAAGAVPVAFASAAGPMGPGYPETAGHSSVWDATGALIARADSRPGTVAVATLRR